MSAKKKTDENRLLIFDTTLRDGEQSPGASLNHREKLEIARQLALLKVDIMLPDPRPGCSGWVYFEHIAHIGETPGASMFKYTFEADKSRAHVAEILDVESRHLIFCREQVENLEKQLEAVKASVPYTFRDCVVEDR